MADPLRFLRRIGKLKDATFSSCYVHVESYDPVLGEYRVKVPRDRGDIRDVKASDIEFQTTMPEFMDTFPNPPRFVIQESFDIKNIPSGSVVDFTECTADPVASYLFVGHIALWANVERLKTVKLC